MPPLRLDKIISDSGIASRSEAAALIRRGCVAVDGKQALSGAEKYEPESVTITVGGERLEYKRFCYIMLNKPAGFVSATEDNRERTVIELLDERCQKLGLFPVGRLDKDAEGLLLLTNDGDFAHRVTSPSKHIFKRYYVKTVDEMTDEDIKEFAKGLTLGDGTVCKPAILEPLPGGGAFITLHEGKYHQVKRMVAASGKQVLYLKRVAVGGLALDESLAPGGYRGLTELEINSIFDNR